MNSKINLYGWLIYKVTVLFCSIVVINCAKSAPTAIFDRSAVFKRAASLDNGINISWLEQTWNPHTIDENQISGADFVLLKKLGFKSVHLPVDFEFYAANRQKVQQLLMRINEVWQQCQKSGLKLVIDYHNGGLNDTNYVDETRKAINFWRILAKRYLLASADDLFFEIYNEPPHMNPQRWKDAAYNIVAAIHKLDTRRTLLVGASNYNSIYELSRFVRLADENIIYVFHFYEPFLFTHQGAAWIGNPAATTGVPFPYSVEKFPVINPKTKGTWGESNYYQYKTDGNEQSVNDKLQIVKSWAAKYDVPVLCSEYGVYRQYADLNSRCRYLKAVRGALHKLNIPGMLWDYNANFSIFNGKPSLQNLPNCMKQVIGYVVKNNNK